MSSAWFSQLFDNIYGGGLLLALPYEALADWNGSGEDYDELIEEIDQFLLHPIGATSGLFITDDDGVHQAHWMRRADERGVTLVVWSEWDDPNRRSLPEDAELVAKAWRRGEDPRRRWLQDQLSCADLDWQRHEAVQHIPGGALLLTHAEGRPLNAKFAKPRAVARCGQVVPVGLTPGDYVIETTCINELPEGANFCLIARWVPA